MLPLMQPCTEPVVADRPAPFLVNPLSPCFPVSESGFQFRNQFRPGQCRAGPPCHLYSNEVSACDCRLLADGQWQKRNREQEKPQHAGQQDQHDSNYCDRLPRAVSGNLVVTLVSRQRVMIGHVIALLMSSPDFNSGQIHVAVIVLDQPV